ncbi:MAG: alpha-glucan family phosphorylase [Candidatus Desulfofervidaceae bacterium]|nr:alpha-glucan family phosphorylase [Candidatus Desulfofervidaceae bacterium]MDL1969514.1 alpha-glucan family phosphorylase [Candidatus Desulfofervidaceae bacterium]
MNGNINGLHIFTVALHLPPNLKPLEELAYNLWFAWNPEVIALFRRLDRWLWEETRHNPVLMLSQLSRERIQELSQDEAFLAYMHRVYNEFQNYLKSPYFAPFFQAEKDFLIAYFSAEFGLTDCLPMYSGGLGVLAGDQLKSASDLNLPLVGIGLLYQHGYFRQALTIDGIQKEIYPENDFYHMPLRLEKNAQGNPILIKVDLKGKEAYAQIWRVDIGRIRLYLLDANIPQNPPHIRAITFRLYDADREIRLQQEILLGIGGVRALHALGINPTIYHMNEGHSAFAGLERIRILREKTNVSFDAAHLAVMASNVFTTHTSVPAGIDIFDPHLVEAYFANYAPKLGISIPVLLGLGRKNPADHNEPFCMNILAMKLSGHINAVSKLHKRVSQKLWHILWPAIPEEDVPIKYITNGVHVPSWISHEMVELYNRYLGPHWFEDPDNEKVWSRVMEIPDEELWGTHERRRERLVAFCRRKLQKQLIRRGAPQSEIMKVSRILNPEALTIVWARRIVTYKRPTLIFRNPERLAQILNNPTRPVQIIIAGKAHPADEPAKALIKQIVSFTKDERFRYRLVFIEDYDLEVGRYLVEGADIWLNTPRKPNEACGTSGMKAIANGALHLSTGDGWWAEAYKPELGWLIGFGEEYSDPNYQDEVESNSLYNLLEHEIVPLFYDRGPDGLPHGWVHKMKLSMRHLCPKFNSHRMLEEYVQNFYLPAFDYWQKLSLDNLKGANELSQWKNKIMTNWDKVSVLQVEPTGDIEIPVGEELKIQALVQLGELTPEEVRVEVCYGRISLSGKLKQGKAVVMKAIHQEGDGVYRFEGNFCCQDTGRFGYKLKIVPHHSNLVPSYYLLGVLVVWG